MGIGFAEHHHFTLRTVWTLPQLTHWREFRIEWGSHAPSGDFNRLSKEKAPAEASAISIFL
jgi:hypothetical protein